MSKEHPIAQRLDQICTRISEPAFLQNKGLGNEVGIHVFCYDPQDETAVQHQIRLLKDDAALPCRIIECDLYEAFLTLLEQKRVLSAVPGLEAKRGKDYLLRQLQKIATPQALLEASSILPARPRDVIFLTGVGKIHPFMRAHKMLDSIQPLCPDTPIVLFYPGTFNGQSLSLFNLFNDGNYYRAFNLL